MTKLDRQIAANVKKSESEYMQIAIKAIRAGKPKKVFNGWDFQLECKFSASANLYVIRAAWDKGLNLENEADGFGLGAGTLGDWSAIRDSSSGQVQVMTKKAIVFLAKKGIK